MSLLLRRIARLRRVARLARLSRSAVSLPARLLAALALVVSAWGGNAAPPVAAQDASSLIGLGSARRPVQVTLAPAYQAVRDDGQTIGQTTTSLQLLVPFARRWTFAAATGYARSTGTGLTSVGGLDDLALSLTYAQPLGRSTLVASLGTRLPSGKQRLTGQPQPGVGITGELGTTTLTSQPFYGFRVGTFGEGFAFKPSLTWAVPLGERVVVGAAATYRYRGPYDPVAGAESSYDPGDEVIVSGGLSVALTGTSALSVDLAYTRFGRDELGAQATVQAGRQLALTSEVIRNLARGYVRVVGRYQDQARSSVPDSRFPLAEAVFRDQQITPTQGQVLAEVSLRVGSRLVLAPRAGARFYGAVRGAAFQQEAQQVVDVGVTPTIELGRRLSLQVTGGLTVGTFTGYQVGLGTTWRPL
jgi:hypothetical protein